jgi:hypothetical protein
MEFNIGMSTLKIVLDNFHSCSYRQHKIILNLQEAFNFPQNNLPNKGTCLRHK